MQIRTRFEPKPGELTLHAKQVEVFQWRSRFKVVTAGRRWGKALALDTPIPTPAGWTTMGALKDGDMVFDEAGKPCRVVYAHAVMHDRPCYEVEFSDGSKVIADGEHLWSTWTHAERKNGRRNPNGGHGPGIRTTEEIARTLTVGARGDTNHSVPCTQPVEYPARSLPIDPYLLGAWLGDGDSRSAWLCCGDEDLDHFRDQVRESIGAEPTLSKARTHWRVGLTAGRGKLSSGIQTAMRGLGVLGNKHIPDSYLQASVEQRLALLQGLMDSDGTCNKAGNCEFTGANEALVRQTLELILSLGIKATLIEGRATINGRDCGAKYRVKFSTDLKVFRLRRKLGRLPTTRKFRIDHRFIKAVRPVASVPVRCITVDSPNSLYLCTRSFVPTHNTQLAKASLISFAAGAKRRLVWYVAPSYRMAKQIMWPELMDSLPAAWIKKVNETTLTIILKNGSRIELKGADNPDSLRGVGIHYLVMDEVQDIDPEAWTKVLRPTLASTGGHAMMIGTPKSYNFLYDLHMKGQDPANIARGEWKSWQFPTITSPFIPRTEIEAARRDMDEKSFKQEFLASFETMSGRVYHAFDRNHNVKSCPFNPNLPIWVGQDFNIDPMSSVILQPQLNGEVWIVDEISLKASNTAEVVDELERRYFKHIRNVSIFPDPAGGYRQHARGETDLDIFKEKGFKRIRYRAKHPPVADRINCVNRMWRAADGTVRLFVDPRCKELIKSVEQSIYKEGTRDVDKTLNIEHMGDALGYPIELMFPIHKPVIAGISL